jgi:hypothetical protein
MLSAHLNEPKDTTRVPPFHQVAAGAFHGFSPTVFKGVHQAAKEG